MRSAPGYTLTACLIVISCLMLLMLALLTQLHTAQKLVNITLQSDEAYWQTRIAAQETLAQIKISECPVPWQKADGIFFILTQDAAPYCLARKNAIEIRYAILQSPQGLPYEINLVARSSAHSHWLWFQQQL